MAMGVDAVRTSTGISYFTLDLEKFCDQTCHTLTAANSRRAHTDRPHLGRATLSCPPRSRAWPRSSFDSPASIVALAGGRTRPRRGTVLFRPPFWSPLELPGPQRQGRRDRRDPLPQPCLRATRRALGRRLPAYLRSARGVRTRQRLLRLPPALGAAFRPVAVRPDPP